jgi:bacillithiol biosynthesis cysteine-adding enzyme BshC
MNNLAQVTFERFDVDYASLPTAADLLAKLAADDRALHAHFPLLERAPVTRASESPFTDRAAAARILAEYNPTRTLPTATTRYVVAGQQAGLLTGPLYAFLKAVSAIAIARDLSRGSPDPVRPLFWIASEDHDVLEVNRVTVNGRRFVHPFEHEIVRGQMPQVADISLRQAREPLLAFLRETLPESEFTAGVLDWVAAANFDSYETAFRDMMAAIFDKHDLLLVDPIVLRALTSPVLAAAVERWPEVEEALARGAGSLREHGLEPPLDGTNLFEIVDGKRVPIEIAANRVNLSTGARSLQEAAEVIREHPAAFSPGAALRPVCQDAVLPVVATLGGPSELTYLLQILPIYDVVGVHPSQRAPRISATFVTPAVTRALAKVGAEPARVFDIPARLRDAHEGDDIRKNDPRIRTIEERARQLLAEIDAIEPKDPPRWLRTGRESIDAATERIVERLVQAKLESEGLGRRRLERIADAVLPDGKLQERVVNITQFLNLYGPGFVDGVIAKLDPWATTHQVVVVSAPSKEK